MCIFLYLKGERDAVEILRWLKKKIQPGPIEFKYINYVKDFTKSDELAVMGFFKVGLMGGYLR